MIAVGIPAHGDLPDVGIDSYSVRKRGFETLAGISYATLIQVAKKNSF